MVDRAQAASPPRGRKGRRRLLAGVALVFLAAPLLQADEPPPEQVEFFERTVRPILVEKCQTCHGVRQQKGGLRLDSRENVLKGGESGPVVVPGKPAKSELVRAVKYEADGFQMPPTGKLDPAAINALAEWVRLGAPWPSAAAAGSGPASKAAIDLAERSKHWSFQPLRPTIPPTVRGELRAHNPVDPFIAARLDQAGLSAAPPADRRTLLRRIHFDLVGLPPSKRDIDAFLADRSPTAYEKVVDRLLASPHYGERWGRHWLDLVRYAETYGHEFDFDIPDAWPYRDYVVRAFNGDVPYDQFIKEHVAGDLLVPRRNAASGINESIIGTAFWWFGQAKHSPVDIRAEECETIANQIDVFGRAFLGLSIACARCHDHKFDPVRTQDYYALAGFLESSRQQSAFLDPTTSVDRFASWWEARKTTCRKLLAAAAEAEYSVGTLESAAVNQTDAEGILAPWRELSVLSGRAFAERRQKLAARLIRQLEQYRASIERSVLFEDFRGPSFPGWSASGSAFGSAPSQAGDFVPGAQAGDPIVHFAPPGAAHSGLISGKLRGTIRSKTFAIEKPYIHYRAQRCGGRDAAGRQFKAGQLNLVVDGFQIIREPLYGHLSLVVPRNAPLAWYSQDVSKFVGSRAYIELVDEDDGFLVVDSIRFSDDSHPPPDCPNRVAAALCGDPSIDSALKLAAGYSRVFAESLELWKSGRLAEDSLGSDRVPFLACLCRCEAAKARFRSNPHVTALLADRERRIEAMTPSRRAIAMTDGSAVNERVLIRGNHKKPGDVVPRRFLEVFGGRPIPPVEPGSGRMELARELTGKAQALLARVIVNRLWQHHFARGLVDSVDDFGKMGQPPSHPELLDFLAAELIRSGWSIKHVQRLLVLSATYRRSSRFDDARAAGVDPADRLLYRMPVMRVEGEVIRDAVLCVSGRLDERMEGPPVSVHLDEFMTGRGRPTHSGPIDGSGRRSVYLAVRRNFLNPLLVAFDFPPAATTMGRRGTSNVPAQALTLLNDSFIEQQARHWADRLCGERALRGRELISRLYEEGLARRPTDAEIDASGRFLDQELAGRPAADRPAAVADLCHVLFNLKEFIYLD